MKILSFLCAALITVTSFSTMAADRTVMLNISDIMQSADYKNSLDPDIAFYFGDQSYSGESASHGTVVTNKKTNAFNKSDEEACRWVTLSALMQLQERAKREGGNAVVDIVSYYKKRVMKSESEIECHAGAFIAGTALRGRVVKLD